MTQDPRTICEFKGKGKGSGPAVREGINSLGKGIPKGATLSTRAHVQQELSVFLGTRLSAPFIKKKKEAANLGISVRSRILNRLEANQGSEIILWQSPKQERKLLR